MATISNTTKKNPFNLGAGLSINSSGGLNTPTASSAMASLVPKMTQQGLQNYQATLPKLNQNITGMMTTKPTPVTQSQATAPVQTAGLQPMNIQASQNQPIMPTPQTSNLQVPQMTSSKGLFGDVVSSLAKPQQPALTTQAFDKYGKAVEDLAKFRKSEAEKFRDIKSDPVSARVMQGRASAVQQANAEIEAALQGAVQEQQAAIGFGQQQQSLDQAAQGAAAGFAQPQVTAFGQTIFNPLAGTFGGGQGNLDPQQQSASLAQQVMQGRMTYDQALASIGYAGQAGTAFLNQAITAAGGNPLQLQSQGAAQQSNIGQQATAATDIARTGLEQATNQYMQMYTAAQFADSQSNAVENVLRKTGLNNVSSTDYNKVLNDLKGRFSDTDFASLSTSLQEAQFAYSNLLSTGGSTPTTNDTRALNTLNINQSASAIRASIAELNKAVQRRLESQAQLRQTYEQNLQQSNQAQQQQALQAPAGGSQNQQGSGGIWDW